MPVHIANCYFTDCFIVFQQSTQSAFYRAAWDILQMGQLAAWEWQKVRYQSLLKHLTDVLLDAKASLLFASFFLRMCSEVPLLEDTLMRILVIGLSRDLPLGPADAMELADHLVKRAAGVQSDGKIALLVRHTF